METKREIDYMLFLNENIKSMKKDIERIEHNIKEEMVAYNDAINNLPETNEYRMQLEEIMNTLNASLQTSSEGLQGLIEAKAKYLENIDKNRDSIMN